jgi:dephospho-CoA kinase
MEKIIIGLTGSLCAGKGTMAKHLIELGFHHQVLSDRIRDEIRSRGQEINRTLLQDVGNELRLTFGGAVLAERTLEIIANTSGNIVIDGVRNPNEIDFLRNNLNAKIIGIHAPKEKRLEWYLARAKERGEDGKTPEDFERDDNRDFGVGEPENGQQVGKCLEMADIFLWNDGPKSELYKECDLFLKNIYNFDPEIHHPHIERK